ncbi:hypothetical protein EBZ38_13785 [bacterium]|nr:hypothetical protein [bacterium]NDC94961.1 hypothetical protein [bacterium]NDD85329.1 hypothetical protein [bacterium]
MNKFLTILVASSILFGSSDYNGSTTAPVVLAGGIIKAKGVEIVHKYRRKDCPVCKGQGWYLSGDKIKKIECKYCEPDKGSGTISVGEIISINPAVPQNNNHCINGQCKPRTIIRRK